MHSYFVIFYIRQFSTVENSSLFPASVFILVISVLWCQVWGNVSPVWTSSTWLLSSSPRAKIFVLNVLLKVLFQSAYYHASLPLYTPAFFIFLLQVWYLESSLILEIWLLVTKNEHPEWIPLKQYDITFGSVLNCGVQERERPLWPGCLQKASLLGTIGRIYLANGFTNSNRRSRVQQE